MCANYENAKDIVCKCGQEHLLFNYDKLDGDKKQQILNQILSINFNYMDDLYKKTKTKQVTENIKIEPISYIDKTKIDEQDKKRYVEKGREAIKQGKYAVVTMAGGQGTRLRT